MKIIGWIAISIFFLVFVWIIKEILKPRWEALVRDWSGGIYRKFRSRKKAMNWLSEQKAFWIFGDLIDRLDKRGYENSERIFDCSEKHPHPGIEIDVD